MEGHDDQGKRLTFPVSGLEGMFLTLHSLWQPFLVIEMGRQP